MNRTFGEKFRSLCLAVDPEDLLLVFFVFFFYNHAFYLDNCLLHSSQLKSEVLMPKFKTI